MIERLGDVPANFDVLRLVFADRDDVGIVSQDVCGLENRIGEQTSHHGQAFGNLILVRNASFQQAHRRAGHQQPAQLRNFWHIRLNEQSRLFGV